MDFTSSSILSLSTFTKKTTPDNLHTYWVSPPRPRSTPLPARDPIIFVPALASASPSTSPLSSTSLSGHVPHGATLKGIEMFYKDLGVKKAVWVGHSLGSVVCSWVCRERGDAKGGLDLLIWYFVSQEMHISLSLRRHFWWYRAVLFPKYLPLLKPTSPPPSPSRSTKLLQTAIGPLSHPRPRTATDTPFATTVEKHLAFHHVRTVTWRGFTHGQMCVRRRFGGGV
ncbi:hypothetical protein BC829DRAFT_445418 [Chytridium lagenaria]|nr:hypothetical protein BC829DRAFT_445418 [Chytridium lagenaria]